MYQENISDFSVETFIDSKKVSMYTLQKNKYLRGSFNLFNNCKIQNKTFFIEIEGNHTRNNTENETKNKTENETYILEFSTNFKEIKPIFNEEFNYYFF